MNNLERPLIVQSDRSLLLEVNHPLYNPARDAIAKFAEIEKSPEHIHTYRITPISLWNAASAGYNAKDILKSLEKFSRYPVPDHIKREVEEYISRYGKLKLIKEGDSLFLTSGDAGFLQSVRQNSQLKNLLSEDEYKDRILISPLNRGLVKQALIKIGFPVEDIAGYVDGDALAIDLRDKMLGGKPFHLRKYQTDSADIFYAAGSAKGGSGVIVLPCGAGKTVVGMATMAKIKTHTLILVTNVEAARQWRRELLDKTTLTDEQIGEYSGECKEIRPVTIASYQILTYRKRKTQVFPHFSIFNQRNWGLIIYDEVHLLPAPVFRITADIQARRRLGLTATLIREDRKEDEVFSLIGPKKYDIPWKDLELEGWIATATCTEVRVSLPDNKRAEYAMAPMRNKIRIAMENPMKIKAAELIVERHKDDRILIIGQYIEQLNAIAESFKIPLITGSTRNRERGVLYEKFRKGEILRLIVSKVGNFAIDLPDANVAIQVSGTFGSRQEEAQRLGRILRPKNNKSQANFYSIVTRETRDQDFAMNRQLFLSEQGYNYRIVSMDELY